MIDAASATRRYLAMHLPWLPADRARRTGDAPPDAAFAVVATVGGTMRIVAVAAAAARFVLIGLTLADARARLPTLPVVADDPAADARIMAWLADGCERYSPRVALTGAATMVIDITGCLTGFADEGALANDVHARLAGHGFTARWRIATTPAAAAALAQCDLDAAASLPVTALPIDAERQRALRQAGLTTIGAVAARPPAVVAARFGAAVPSLVAQLLGTEDDGLVPRRRVAEIVVEHRLVDPVVTVAGVMRVLDQLIDNVVARLGERAQGGRAFAATLFRCDGHVERLAVRSSRATRNRVLIRRLFDERLAGFGDPLDPGFGYDLVRLSVPDSDALVAAQLDLADDRRGSDDVADLIDRMATRLGPARVRRLVRGDSHLPERASGDLACTAWPAGAWAAGDGPARRPSHLFTPPRPITVIAEVPDGPPRSFAWSRTRYDIVHAEGPERIAAEWWRRRSGRGATRDYYHVEDRHGRRFWLFRNGLYGSETAAPEWFLHGLFP